MRFFVPIASLLLWMAGCSQLGSPGFDANIYGLDAEGRFMHLADFRGSVVLVDFWVSTCPCCKKFHQVEPVLAKRYENRPFVMLGVNADAKRETLLETQKHAPLAMRCWWDGANGPIARQWNVHGFPTIVLIDHHGRVRERWEGAPPPGVLDAKLDELIKEAEKR